MTEYLVESTNEADEQARAVDAWWRDQRSGSADLFLAELSRALELLSRLPMLGAPYLGLGASLGLRRLLLRSVRYHVYYSVDEAARIVTVRAIWHTSRGQGPF